MELQPLGLLIDLVLHIRLHLIYLNLVGKTWQIASDSPNLPKFASFAYGIPITWGRMTFSQDCHNYDGMPGQA